VLDALVMLRSCARHNALQGNHDGAGRFDTENISGEPRGRAFTQLQSSLSVRSRSRRDARLPISQHMLRDVGLTVNPSGSEYFAVEIRSYVAD
jgi:hypothetical protein